MTVNDVAEAFGVAPVTVRRWQREGFLSSIPAGRTKLFSREQVVHIMRKNSDWDFSPGRLMNGNEVADLYRVSLDTVLRWADEGMFDTIVTPTRHFRFSRQQVEFQVRSATIGDVNMWTFRPGEVLITREVAAILDLDSLLVREWEVRLSLTHFMTPGGLRRFHRKQIMDLKSRGVGPLTSA